MQLQGTSYIASRATIAARFKEIDRIASLYWPIENSHPDHELPERWGAKIPLVSSIQALIAKINVFLAHNTRPVRSGVGEKLCWINGTKGVKGTEIPKDWTLGRDNGELVCVISGDSHNPSGHAPYTTISVRPGMSALPMIQQKPSFYFPIVCFRG